jgi:predicted signal transduction protein with EAL and GGDEF domain
VTRSGGEEFIIVLPGTELAGGTAFAERLRAVVARASALTVSSGVAMVSEGDDVKTLLTRADSALYAAKAAGRNCVWCHNGDDAFPAASQDLMSEAPTAGARARGLRESLTSSEPAKATGGEAAS